MPSSAAQHAPNAAIRRAMRQQPGRRRDAWGDPLGSALEALSEAVGCVDCADLSCVERSVCSSEILKLRNHVGTPDPACRPVGSVKNQADIRYSVVEDATLAYFVCITSCYTLAGAERVAARLTTRRDLSKFALCRSRHWRAGRKGLGPGRRCRRGGCRLRWLLRGRARLVR